MKSSTYASLALIIFLKHRNDMSRSVEAAIRTTDRLCEQLKLQVDLSHMTKYRIISDLIKHDIISVKKSKKRKKLRVSQTIIDLLVTDVKEENINL